MSVAESLEEHDELATKARSAKEALASDVAPRHGDNKRLWGP